MNAIVLTPVEWEWFKQLARSRVENRMAPQDIRRKLVELKLMEESRVGGLGPTVQGRDVLKLVDDRWRGAYRRRGGVCLRALRPPWASGKDRNGQTLARVSCNGTDAGAEQVRRGPIGAAPG